MKKHAGPITDCHCDHPGCNVIRSNFGEQEMCEITFGVHPNAIEARDSVAVQFKQFNFCSQHHQFYVDLLLAGIAKEFLPLAPLEVLKSGQLSYSSYFQKGLGCWITIHDRISDFGTKNYQMPYDPFEKIYRWFNPIVICQEDSNRSIPASMKELRSWQFNTDSLAPESTKKILQEFVRHVVCRKEKDEPYVL